MPPATQQLWNLMQDIVRLKIFKVWSDMIFRLW